MQSTVNNQYNIILPNDKAATYKVVTFIIALLNAAGFTAFYFRETEPGKQILVTIGAVITIIAFTFYIIQLRTKRFTSFKIEISFIIAALIWFIYGNIWLALFLLLFAIFGFYSNKKLVIKFSNDGIEYPSFPVKHFAWAAVDFVILKDGILTIELKNNHIYQFTLDKDIADTIDELRFNSFCKAQKSQN